MEVAKLVLEYLKVLIWPATVGWALWSFRSQITSVFERLRHADFPGGFGVDLREEIDEGKALSQKVQAEGAEIDARSGRPAIPVTESNARMLHLGLRPSPSGLDMSYYRSLASQDPNVALAGVRIEIEILARNLAKGFSVPVADRESATRLIRRLYDAGAITNEQMLLVMKVVRVCNAAVHGVPISREEADDVIDLMGVLADQYLDWLGWGFGDGWTPRCRRELAGATTSGRPAQ